MGERFKEILKNIENCDNCGEKLKNLPEDIKIIDYDGVEHRTRGLISAYINSEGDYETLINGAMTTMEVMEAGMTSLAGTISFLLDREEDENRKKILFKIFIDGVNAMLTDNLKKLKL